jgi:Cys-tRNA(Pro) deacylase
MSKLKTPVTSAVRVLRTVKVNFSDHLYDYQEKGGTAVSARELGVDEHAVIKTLIMEDDRKRPLMVLMHGDLQVSEKQLARIIGVKTILPCAPETAHKHSGYLVGGNSPFGTRTAMPIYMEETILRTCPKLANFSSLYDGQVKSSRHSGSKTASKLSTPALFPV